MWDKFKDPKLQPELRKLADLRFEGQEATQTFKDYVRTKEEKMAVMFEALLHAPDKFRQVAPKSLTGCGYSLRRTRNSGR